MIVLGCREAGVRIGGPVGDGFGEGRHDLAIGGLALAESEFEAVKAMNASYAGAASVSAAA